MITTGRRDFFKSVFVAGATLAATGMSAIRPPRAEAAAPDRIKGVCLFVPTLGKAADFVEMMNRNAPGSWTAYPLTKSLSEQYFAVRNLYEEVSGAVNTFVGVVDPATFAVIHEAIIDCGGGFHYITYEERNRVTFSVRMSEEV